MNKELEQAIVNLETLKGQVSTFLNRDLSMLDGPEVQEISITYFKAIFSVLDMSVDIIILLEKQLQTLLEERERGEE
jgi:hypothetical protein